MNAKKGVMGDLLLHFRSAENALNVRKGWFMSNTFSKQPDNYKTLFIIAPV